MSSYSKRLGRLLIFDAIAVILSAGIAIGIFYVMIRQGMESGPLDSNIVMITCFFAAVKILLMGIVDITGIAKKFYVAIILVGIINVIIVIFNVMMVFGIPRMFLLTNAIADIVLIAVSHIVWGVKYNKNNTDERRMQDWLHDETEQESENDYIENVKAETLTKREPIIRQDYRPTEENDPEDAVSYTPDEASFFEEDAEIISEEQIPEHVGTDAVEEVQEESAAIVSKPKGRSEYADLFSDTASQREWLGILDNESADESQETVDVTTTDSLVEENATIEAESAIRDEPTEVEAESPIVSEEPEAETSDDRLDAREDIEDIFIDEEALQEISEQDQEESISIVPETDEAVAVLNTDSDDAPDIAESAAVAAPIHTVMPGTRVFGDDEDPVEADRTEAASEEDRMKGTDVKINNLIEEINHTSTDTEAIEKTIVELKKELEGLTPITDDADILASGELIREKLKMIIDKQFLVDGVLDDLVRLSQQINKRIDDLDAIESDLERRQEQLSKKEFLFMSRKSEIEDIDVEVLPDEIILENGDAEIIIDEEDLDIIKAYLKKTQGS